MSLLGSSGRWFFGVVVLVFFFALSSCSAEAPPALPSTVEEDERPQEGFLSRPASPHKGKGDTGTDWRSSLVEVMSSAASKLPVKKEEAPDQKELPPPSPRRLGSGTNDLVGSSGSGPGAGHAGPTTPAKMQHHHPRRGIPNAASLLEEEARLKAKTKIVVTSSNTQTAATVSPLFLVGGSIGGFALIFCLWYCSIFVR